LTNVDYFDHLANLELLNVYETGIKMRPALFDGLSNLKYLNIANTSFGELKASQFSNLKKLLVLNLFDCEIEKIEQDAFKGLGALKELNLGANQIGPFDSSQFVNFKVQNGLESLEKVVFHINYEEELIDFNKLENL
jgi:Leucine-rich repeat (LRR) protein